MAEALRIFNTMTGKKERFVPLNGNNVWMYACGPTVYSRAHAGHARAAIVVDAAQRWLRFLGFQVKYARNITDVDDKIINRAEAEGISPEQLAWMNTFDFWQDMESLNVAKPDVEPRATQFIPQMFAFIEELIAAGHAYVSAGDVYFDVSSFAEHGKLSKKNLDELRSDVRKQVLSQAELAERKRDGADFALWKSSAPDKPGWTSPWGHGRPGWHIECSTMIRHVFGETIDIHAGGEDLIFPHHENEIAQSESLSHKPLARFWMHNGMITVDGKKMGKSHNNFTTIRDLLAVIPADAIRMLILQTHYRHSIDFSMTGFVAAKTAVQRLIKAASLDAVAGAGGEFESVRRAESDFASAMNDDFNTAMALTVLFKLSDRIGETKDSNEKAAAAATLRKYAGVLGFTLSDTSRAVDAIAGKLVDLMLEIRKTARAKTDFATSDFIRDRLKELGINVKDSKDGTTWERG
jgi:cysteinyl-tRNA synthetase